MSKERLSKAQQIEAEKYGGFDGFDYKKEKGKPYCDKPAHFLRSCYHQPNHLKHKPR